MDAYGYIELSDAPEIAKLLTLSAPIVFSYAPDPATQYLIFIVPNWFPLNNVNIHGNAAGSFLVGIERKGAFHFKFDPNNPFHEDYIAEKLNLPIRSATGVTNLFNEISKHL